MELTASTFEASSDAASLTGSSEPAEQLQIERAEALLRSASLLLARDEPASAAYALHVALARALGRAPPAPYASHRQAEDFHREIGSELARQRGSTHPTFSRTLRSRELLARRSPQWLAAGALCAVLAFLVLRYAYAIYARWRWQGEHPNGAWISRYYAGASFQDQLVTRYDVDLDYNWGFGGPAEAMARDNWSATWDTCLVVKSPLRAKLRFSADDAGKLRIDDQLVSTIRRPGTNTVPINLAPGVHHLRVDYQERRRQAYLGLYGLDPNGSEAYSFQRPRLDGAQVICDQRR